MRQNSGTLPKPRWSEVTALFGGRFDPPHLGHREAVRGLFQALGIKRVLIIPSASPPHKPAFASAETRAKLAEINFKPTPADRDYPTEIEMSRTELNRAQSNSYRPTYSYDTITELRSTYSPLSPAQLAFVIGADQLSQLNTWYRFPEVLGLCHWIVLERQPDGKQMTQTTLHHWQTQGWVKASEDNWWHIRGHSTWIHTLPTQAPQLSSTEIRESIAKTGHPPAHSLLTEVEGYLKLHQVYGMKKST